MNLRTLGVLLLGMLLGILIGMLVSRVQRARNARAAADHEIVPDWLFRQDGRNCASQRQDIPPLLEEFSARRTLH